MTTKIAVAGLALTLAVIGAGCEADETRTAQVTTTPSDVQNASQNSQATTSTSTPTPPPAAPSFTGDELDVSSAQSFGTHAGIRPQDASVTRALYRADKEGDLVMLDFDTLKWTRQGKVDGRVCIYWKDGGGNVIGGHFDWHGAGQTAKTLENIGSGYLNGKKPPKGAPIWFCIINVEGTERTNMKQSSNPW